MFDGLRPVAAIVFGCLFLSHAVAATSDPVLETFEYGGNGTFHGTYADMNFTIDAIGPPDGRGPRLRVAIGGKPAFKLQLAGESGNGSATVKIVRLDGDTPQIVFQHSTFGPHCCVVSKIATRVDGHWIAVLGDSLDGDRGYEFKDIAGNGTSELISYDRSFLYRFSGYASSYVPIVVMKLEGARLVDVTRDPRFKTAVRESLVEMESFARKDDAWHQNGFLGAWVATKVLLGEGPSAWVRMLETYDTHSSWPMDDATFPKALRAHLLMHRYIPDALAYPIPSVGASR